MKKTFISIIALIAFNMSSIKGYSQTSGSGIIPPEHVLDWSKAGIPGGIPNYEVGLNVTDAPYNAYGDGSHDDTQAIKDAIAACPEGMAVYIPEGTYLITGQLSINKGIVLRGAGPSKTVIRSTYNVPPIRITSNVEPDSISIFAAQAMKGSATFQVVSAQGIYAGDFLQLYRSSGGSTIVEVAQVNGNQITLTTGFPCDFEAGSGVFRYAAVVVGAGVEDMKIFLDLPEWVNFRKIQILRAARCWVKSIETAGVSHEIEVIRGFQCEIRDSYFYIDPDDIQQSANFDSYGVYISGSNMCLTENNTMHHHRHTYVTNATLGANVFAYNTAWGSWSGPTTRWSGMGDMCLHHSQAEAILMEGNSVEMVRFDGNLPTDKRWNVVLRNRSKLRGIDGIANPPTTPNFLIGNEMPERYLTFDGGFNEISVKMYQSLQHGNYVTYQNQGLIWDPSLPQTIPSSYYLTEKPEWFGDLAWPPFGGDLMEAGNGYNPNRSPSEVRLWTEKFPENAPTNLGVGEINQTSVELNWTNNSVTGATPEGTVDSIDFIIVRSTDGTNFERIATTSQTTFKDPDLIAGQQYWYYVRARNHITIDEPGTSETWSGPGGESEPSNIITVLDGTVSLEPKIIEDNALSVFPNPAKDVLYFNFPENQAQTISIYNNSGQVVMEEKYNDNSVNISELDKGIYFLVIRGVRKDYKTKFIIE